MLQLRGAATRSHFSHKPGDRSGRAVPAAGSGSHDKIANREDHGADGELSRFYQRLLEELGPQGWWPGRTRLEVILGAILTQNTAWRNTALAIQGLRQAGLLNLRRLRQAGQTEIEALIRPAGFFRRKARAIRGVVQWLDRSHGGSLDRMFRRQTDALRGELLKINGLGPETVDAILLYAGGKPIFVADAYTRRILARHGMLEEHATYAETQEFIHRRLEREADVYNEFHALLVEVGKRHCRRGAPRCQACPLEPFLPPEREAESLKTESAGTRRPEC